MRRTLAITLIALASASAAQAQSLAAPSMFDRAVLARAVQQHTPRFVAATQPSPDSRLNGFLIGFVAGAIPGVIFGSLIHRYCDNESIDCVLAIPAFGGLFGLAGGGIGYAVDSAIKSEGHSLRIPRRPAVKLSVKF